LETFIAEIMGSLAWSAVAIFAIFILKDKLAELLPRLKKLKHKDTDLEFIEGVSESAKETDILGKPDIESADIKLNREVLRRLGNISPSSAVIEAYRIVEVAVVKAIEEFYPDLKGKDICSQVQVSKMLREKVLSSEKYHLLRELLMLRNKAAHDDGFSLTGSPIETYIDVALSLSSELEQAKP
jgi:hypothetical protein